MKTNLLKLSLTVFNTKNHTYFYTTDKAKKKIVSRLISLAACTSPIYANDISSKALPTICSSYLDIKYSFIVVLFSA